MLINNDPGATKAESGLVLEEILLSSKSSQGVNGVIGR
jgi:hypothetical protein